MATALGISFGSLTPAGDVAKAFSRSIADTTIVITGVSVNKIGFALASALASQNPKLLVITGVEEDRIQESVEALRRLHPALKIKAWLMDLASQSDVRTVANSILLDPDILCIDMLINNAATTEIDDRELMMEEDGIEETFATNYVGHFLFTNLLLPKLVFSSRFGGRLTRIINVTCWRHRFSPVRFSDINFKKKVSKLPKKERPNMGGIQNDVTLACLYEQDYSGSFAFAQSKTALVLFSVALSKRLKRYGISSYAVDPGRVFKHGANEEQLEEEFLLEVEKAIASGRPPPKSLDEGANSIVLAAVDPDLPPVNTSKELAKGVYISDCRVADDECADFARDTLKAETLWHLSEGIVQQCFTCVCHPDSYLPKHMKSELACGEAVGDVV